ncbi:MAG: efflux RND transporter periplasmic adaptor subunit [Candidatus Methylomirabilis sp.]
MASHLVRLRPDLVISQQLQMGQPIYIVKDPTTGRFFQLRAPEYFIARQLDGVTPLDTVQRRADEQFGAPLTRETLEQFVQTLWRLGLLEGEGADGGHLAQRRGRIGGSLLYLRLKAFDPDRLLNHLLSKVKFFFTRPFIVCSAALILLAVGITISNWNEIGLDLLRLYRVQALLLAGLTLLCVTTAHEFAHGLTCKRFGGEVREMGFMLLYFMPAFYCNVSDAWLFPEKSKRLWVTFAGAYFEIFLWALATLTWRVTDPETVLNYAALVVMATSGIKTLFNLNPLIKLDGYYLLCDYLEIPNLRQRAMGYLGARIKRMRESAVQWITEATPRERRIYLTYGMLAGVYSFSLLGLIALNLGGFLIGRYQGLGFLLFTGLLATVFRNPLKKVPSKLVAVFRPGEDRASLIRRLRNALAGFTVVLAGLFFVHMELKVAGEFKVLPLQNADVRAEVDGIIAEVYVDEGHVVREGDLIARLQDRDYRAELGKVEAEIEEKRAKLKMLKAGSRREEIEIARAEVAKAKERLKYAREKLETFQGLHGEKAISRLQVQEAEEQVSVRGKELEEADGRLRLLLAGSRPEEIEATEAEITRLETQKRYLQEQLALGRVVSPISGVVTTPKVREKVGEHVKKGDLITKVHTLQTVTAEIPISEKEIADVKVGQQVVLKARAYPEQSFSGPVVSIAPTAAADSSGFGSKTVLVRTEIDNTSGLLKPEMTGNAKIYCGKRRIFDLMTRRLVRYIRVEFWSWW